ncbi:PEGA domain-containing protein [Massilia brevitalea]|uniref:PEGA domain-containing protein n=1 Tax=Massilia brevitalea TaxID=442526 RepID=UPI00273822C3|nr:PEGA domain-containing protein [Massilia brevitalea]
MKRFTQALAAAAITLALSGCASIQSGTSQNVKVSSNPAGATVYVALKKDGVVTNKVAVGVTPLTVTLSRKHGSVFVEKEGYTPVEVSLTTRMNPWMWGNILLTSPLSTSIDTSTGASREYDPGEYMVDLQAVTK